jgi:hypothetical protein
VAERLFVFVQFEFPWELGPPDGRYLLRGTGGEPEHVVVLGTLHGARRAGGPSAAPARRVRRPRGASRPATPEPAPVATARATIIDPVSLSAEHQAEAWLAELDAERETRAAIAVVNRMLYLQRIASADPYLNELSPEQALVIRVGWGEGEQVADGRWLVAREVPAPAPGRGRRGRWPGRRSAYGALRSGERLAHLLGAKSEPLLCEELVLRARRDVDQGRLRHAALELDSAFAAALPELRAEEREDLSVRLEELGQLRAGVTEQARAARDPDGEGPQEEAVVHALTRLEAALRARTAAGVG